MVYLLYHIPSSQVIRALTPLRQNQANARSQISIKDFQVIDAYI